MEHGIVVQPNSTREVAEVIKYCAEHKIPVVPQGGNTSLSGGSVGANGSVILSMSKMDNILELDEENGVITVEAGCILQTVQSAAETKGFVFPLDLGAKGQCQIGGNLATAAGGLNVIRYGPIGRYVLGLEVVLGDGTVLDMDRRLVKDNFGLKLPQLFVGSEGVRILLYVPPSFLLFVWFVMVSLSLSICYYPPAFSDTTWHESNHHPPPSLNRHNTHSHDLLRNTGTRGDH
jgi:FAD/FMN-containing dehydrogenase